MDVWVFSVCFILQYLAENSSEFLIHVFWLLFGCPAVSDVLVIFYKIVFFCSQVMLILMWTLPVEWGCVVLCCGPRSMCCKSELSWFVSVDPCYFVVCPEYRKITLVATSTSPTWLD